MRSIGRPGGRKSIHRPSDLGRYETGAGADHNHIDDDSALDNAPGCRPVLHVEGAHLRVRRDLGCARCARAAEKGPKSEDEIAEPENEIAVTTRPHVPLASAAANAAAAMQGVDAAGGIPSGRH